MSQFMKWFALSMVVANPIMAFLVAYGGGHVLSVATFCLLTVTWFLIYRSNVHMIKTQEELNARLEEMKNDYRS